MVKLLNFFSGSRCVEYAHDGFLHVTCHRLFRLEYYSPFFYVRSRPIAHPPSWLMVLSLALLSNTTYVAFSQKWLTLHGHDSTEEAVAELKASGYQASKAC